MYPPPGRLKVEQSGEEIKKKRLLVTNIFMIMIENQNLNRFHQRSMDTEQYIVNILLLFFCRPYLLQFSRPILIAIFFSTHTYCNIFSSTHT